MAVGVFCYADDIPGECNVTGHENSIEVLGFDHDIAKAIGSDGMISRDRHHGPAVITTYLDKSYPLLCTAMVTNEKIPKIEVQWFRQPPSGSGVPEHYFNHVFKECRVTSVRPHMRNRVADDRFHPYTVTFEFAYKEMEAESITGGTLFVDQLRVS